MSSHASSAHVARSRIGRGAGDLYLAALVGSLMLPMDLAHPLLWALVVLGWAVLLGTLGIVLHGWRR